MFTQNQRIRRRHPGLTLLVLLAAVTAHATTYYVATNGNDAAAGALASPWRTVQKAANTLAPGDTALVRGGVYNEAVTVNVSGSAAGGYVTFQNYPGETPILDGTSLIVPASDNGMFLLMDKNYVALQGFEIRNYRTAAKNLVPAGIFITGAGHDLLIRSNRVHHIETNYTGKNGGDAFGLVVYGTSGTRAITNLVIQGNEVFSLKTGSSESLTVNGNVAGFEVSGNLVHDNNNIGIAFIGFEGTSPNPATDRARQGVCRNNTVWNISSYGNPAYGNEYSADGIYVDGGTDIIIERNAIHHVDVGTELTSEHAGGSGSFIRFRDNLIWSNRVYGISIGGYDALRGRTESCTIQHNTLYHNDTLHQGNGEWALQFDTRSNVFTHNLLVADAQNLLVGNQYSQNTNNLVDWNLYFAPGGTNGSDWEWMKITYSSFAAWQRGTGNDAHSVFADPRFLDAATANFHLATNSPALNTGDPAFVPGSGETDLDGQSRVSGGRTDIGADELNLLSATLGISPLSPNQVTLQLTGEPGHPFVWEQSDTLANWLPFLTNSSTTDVLQITSAIAVAHQFFRARMSQ